MNHSRVNLFAVVLATALVTVPITGAITLGAGAPGGAGQQKPSTTGWQLPADAPDTKNPLTVNDKVLAAGKKVFGDKCEKCHGSKGLGDGPDADPEHAEEMNLTNPKRADRNADGIVFYKVLNGRKKPKMPAFKEELSTEQIWSVVSYVQTLRKK